MLGRVTGSRAYAAGLYGSDRRVTDPSTSRGCVTGVIGLYDSNGCVTDLAASSGCLTGVTDVNASSGCVTK